MKFASPEQMGIRSGDILEYIQTLEAAHLATHDVIIMRHGHIVFEKYWAPFHEGFLHRMYSVTKSFVALAIGFLEQDGLVELDAPIVRYFPEELKDQPDENMRNQTLRHMLMMSTAKPERSWFRASPDDRVRFYFENDRPDSRPSGTVFSYDSTGSFVLGALVERVTGRELMDYLREKLFDRIGVSQEAYMLKCPGGHSWSDSTLICTARDLLKVALFCMNKGRWNGEQILNEAYMTAATTKQIDNNLSGLNTCDSQGYGYLFWMTHDNSFFFNGMGCQFAICVPDKDMILIYNADNQGNPTAKSTIIDSFFRIIARRAEDSALPDDPSAGASLAEYTKDLKLCAVRGDAHSDLEKAVNGVTYEMQDNPMGIRRVRLCFAGDTGTLCYANAQGDKELPFGLCRNEFSHFPQMGYSDAVGSREGNRLYRCAASAAWVRKNQLLIKVQIIDTYLGVLNISIGFTDDQKIGIYMEKTAEHFLNEYQGFAGGTAANM